MVDEQNPRYRGTKPHLGAMHMHPKGPMGLLPGHLPRKIDGTHRANLSRLGQMEDEVAFRVDMEADAGNHAPSGRSPEVALREQVPRGSIELGGGRGAFPAPSDLLNRTDKEAIAFLVILQLETANGELRGQASTLEEGIPG